MNKDISKILFTNETIVERCRELGAQITADYAKDKAPILVSILKGSCFFLAEVAKNIDLNVELDFMDIASYSGTNSTGNIKILMDLDRDVNDENILIIEDIIDTGATLKKVKDLLESRGARSVRIAALLDKAERREKEVEVNYVGFKCPNEFVVGFGLDYDQKYRNLPYIGVLKEEIYTK